MFKRRFAAKRKLIRRKRWGRKPMIRRPVAVKQPVHYFKRTQYNSGWTANLTTADQFANYYGSLSQVPNISDFTGLYDQYKILAMKVTLIPRGNQSDIGTASASVAQSVGVFSVIDYDDNTNLTSISQACQYQNMKMTRSHQVHTRYFKPRIMTSVLSNVSTANSVNTRGWIDINDTQVNHYGIKYALQISPNSSQSFDLKVDYYLAFKSVR